LGRQTAEEARQQYIDLMGADLGLAYDVLRNDAALAFANWAVYRELYSDPDRLRLLNDVAGTLFGVLQRTLLWDVILQLARLVDTPESPGKKQNLTLQSLPSLIQDANLRRSVEAGLTTCRTACASAIVWRNRRLAHRDLGVALRPEAEPLPDIAFADIEQALTSFQELLNLLEAHFNDGATTAYSMIGHSVRADGLAHLLEQGLEAEANGAEL
jgi:hypothetical protein